MKRTAIIMIFGLTLAGCAPGNPLPSASPAICADLAGFWSGLLHGWISFFGLIGSLFDPTIGVYNPCDNGGWYDFGFVLGVGGSGGSTAGAARRRR